MRRRWILLLVGAAVAISLLTVDPAALGFLLDADLLVVTAAAGGLLLRHEVRRRAHQAATSLPVLWCRVGVRLTRQRPRSLLA